jgi:plastocyanin
MRVFQRGVAALALVCLVGASLPLASRAHSVDEPGTHVIHLSDAAIEPATLMIKPGETVIFENTGTKGHWPASNIHPTHGGYPGSHIDKCGTIEAKKIFDACRALRPQETYSFTFDQPGRWKFHDHEQPELGGTIIVEGTVAADNLPSPPPAAPPDVGTTLARLYFDSFPQHLEALLAHTSIFLLVGDDRVQDQARLRQLLAVAGAEPVMEKVLQESEQGPEVLDCHQEAHQIGRIVYELYGGKALAHGDAACSSGFYHGAMEAFFAQHGTANFALKVADLCSLFNTNFSLFNCLHGVGHGIMAYENYDLPAALAACNQLVGDWNQRSCYGGVFMENIVQAQGLGAVPGHKTTWVSDDPYFPCTAVEQSYGLQYECYMIHTGWMLTLANQDFAKVAQQCAEVPFADTIPICFKSLGRDIAGHTARDTLAITKLCELAPAGDHRNHCLIGALNVVIDYWGPRLENQGEEFCAAVETGAQAVCFSTLAERKKEIFDTLDATAQLRAPDDVL